MTNDSTKNACSSSPCGYPNAALYYRRKGFSVTPIKARSKRPLGSWAEFQGRCSTEAEVCTWRQEYPDANVAIVTGAISGVFVLDTDGPKGDDQTKKLGGVPITPESTTQLHYGTPPLDLP